MAVIECGDCHKVVTISMWRHWQDEHPEEIKEKIRQAQSQGYPRNQTIKELAK